MKIRTIYVSNSSSSSFIVWTKNVNSFEQFKDSLKDYEEESLKGYAEYVWYYKVYNWFGNDKNFLFVDDKEWVEKINKNELHSQILPNSIKNLNKNSNEYKELFIEWFVNVFKDYQFLTVNGSDHDDETIYKEDELWNLLSFWNDAFLYMNNH